MLAIESENLQIPEEVWDKVFSTVERIRKGGYKNADHFK